MAGQKVKPDIYQVGARDWDRQLFDELIPLPDGTSYNAYLIKGTEKTVLIDTVDPTKEKVLLDNLKELKIDKIDYVVSNHAEQDHSGAIPKILELYPEAKVVTNQKCKNMLMDLLLIPEDRFIEISDWEKLSIGNKTLQFVFTPWVHWPETLSTYLIEDKVLFSCDFFGSHLATSDLFADDKVKVYESAKRYYAEIMMPFRNSIRSNLKKLEGVDIELIAPSHGPIYRNPNFIIDAYRDWISDDVKQEVIISYVSMHGSTDKIVEFLVDILIQKGLKVKPYNLTVTDIGELAISLVDASTIVIGTPTVLTGSHPTALYAAYLVNILKPKAKFVSVIGSYGWGGKMLEQIKDILSNLKAEMLPNVIIKGYPKEADFLSLKQLAEVIVEKNKNLYQQKEME